MRYLQGSCAILTSVAIVCLLASSTMASFPETKLVGPVADGLFGFGTNIDNGRIMAVSRPSSGSTGYVYEDGGSGLAVTGSMSPSIPGGSNVTAVGLTWGAGFSGSEVVLGQYNAASTATGASGGAFVFQEGPAGTWTQTQAVFPSDGEASDVFGRSVVTNGTTLAVGADMWDSHVQLDEEDVDDDGALYVYEKVGGVWTNEQILLPDLSLDPDWEEGDRKWTVRFGYSAAIDGDVLVGGATYGQEVFVYEKNVSGTWLQAQRVTPSDYGAQAENSDFGIACDLEDGILAVGAYRWKAMGGVYRQGAVFIYEDDGTGQFVETQLIVQDEPDSVRFGKDVVLEGNHLYVGTADVPEVSVYWRNSLGQYVLQGMITPLDATGALGYFMDAEGDTLVCSAHGTAPNGAVYVYEVPDMVFLPGDANENGVIDEEDAAILAANWLKQTGAIWSEGDFNNDGMVNGADATLMATNWHAGVGGSSVPEPGMLVLLLGALAVLTVSRRR